jgi:hypothetical protein
VVLPLEAPEPDAAAINHWRLEVVVVMEDLTLRGGHPNDTIGGAAVGRSADTPDHKRSEATVAVTALMMTA